MNLFNEIVKYGTVFGGLPLVYFAPLEQRGFVLSLWVVAAIFLSLGWKIGEYELLKRSKSGAEEMKTPRLKPTSCQPIGETEAAPETKDAICRVAVPECESCLISNCKNCGNLCFKGRNGWDHTREGDE